MQGKNGDDQIILLYKIVIGQEEFSKNITEFLANKVDKVR